MTPEGKVKARVQKILKDNGIYFTTPSTHGYGRSGVPDFICCYRGYFLAIECKSERGVPTALQNREMSFINKAGGIAMVVGPAELDLLDKWISQHNRI
jgi:hypothetical protein